MAADSEAISYSIVIPVFNEEAVLPVLLRRVDLLLARLDEPAEAIFVDDGSSDSSPVVLQALAKRDLRFRYIGLSRNFGHQIAITAGMDAAQGKAIVVKRPLQTFICCIGDRYAILAPARSSPLSAPKAQDSG